jgi:hypothetical protein
LVREPRNAAEISKHGREDVHARVGIFDPVDGHLVNAQPGALREDEQLGVEEPARVTDLWHELVRNVCAHRLEAALRVEKRVRSTAWRSVL